MLLKVFSFIYIAVILVSCAQKKTKEQEKEDMHPSQTNLERLDTDPIAFIGYIVNTDTAYFFATADSSVKLNTYLVKDEFASVFEIKDDYACVAEVTDSGTYQRGWLQLKDLTRALLTPPKIAKE